MIIKRNVDPGDFVQNSATGQVRPILSVVRTDIMTVVMKLPDTYAPFVTDGTDAIIRLPSRLIKAKVTRFSRSIHPQDRTMRIEIDLYNGSWAEYQQFLRDRWGAYLAGLGTPQGLGAVNLQAAGRGVWTDSMKGSADPLPVFPQDAAGRVPRRFPRLLPRMYGSITLRLKNFQDAYLIPSQAIFSRGGKRYILVVENGKAYRKAVRTQADDGHLAKVTIMARKNTEAGEVDIPVELTGKEEIVIPSADGKRANKTAGSDGQTIKANPAEVSDGQAVKTHPVKKWPEKLGLLKEKI
jgi:hypothetical protein